MNYIFLLVGIVIFFILYNLAKRQKYIRNIESKQYKSKEIIQTYSIEASIERHELRNSTFKRPLNLERRDVEYLSKHITYRNLNENRHYKNAIKTLITIEKMLLTKEDISKKTLRVFVDSQIGSSYILRDHTTVCKINFDKTYNLGGDFVFINFNRKRGLYSINYILTDNLK